jgi:hypothetical protein
MHNAGLRNLHLSINIIRVTKSRRLKWTRHVTCIKVMRNSFMVLVPKPEGKRLYGRPKYKWKGNILIQWVLKK